MKMPIMSGEEYIRQAKKLYPGISKYIIITGGVTKDYSKEVGFDINSLGDSFVEKPFSEAAIRNVLKALS
jgi:CheY-like chemotaxis protein